jgi:hypothetical protein
MLKCKVNDKIKEFDYAINEEDLANNNFDLELVKEKLEENGFKYLGLGIVVDEDDIDQNIDRSEYYSYFFKKDLCHSDCYRLTLRDGFFELIKELSERCYIEKIMDSIIINPNYSKFYYNYSCYAFGSFERPCTIFSKARKNIDFFEKKEDKSVFFPPKGRTLKHHNLIIGLNKRTSKKI